MKVIRTILSIGCAAVILMLFSEITATAQTAVSTTDVHNAIMGKTFTAPQILPMDVNKDGKVDVADLIAIRKSQGVRFIGTMTFDPQFVLAPQNIEMKLPTMTAGSFTAQFDVTNSPFFSNSFTMNGSIGTNSITFSSEGTGILEATAVRNPFQKAVSWKFAITDATLMNGVLQGKFTMTYTSFKSDAKDMLVTGKLYMRDQNPEQGLSLENAGDMNALKLKYGVP